MIADRGGLVKVRAAFAGAVELRVRVGEPVWPGRPLVAIEGEREIETFSARNAGTVAEILVREGAEVEAGTLLLTVLEAPAELPSA